MPDSRDDSVPVRSAQARARASLFLRYWLPVLALSCLIFALSSQPYQRQDIRPLLDDILPAQAITRLFSWLRLHYAGSLISIDHLGVSGFAEFFIRKGAHLFIYALLGAFLFRTFRRSRFFRQWAVPGALAISFLYAATDEIHQVFTFDRTPSRYDVILDTCGALAGIVTLLLVHYRTRRGANPKRPE